MGLMDFIKTQLIDIIEWNQESDSDLMAWRFPRGDNEIKNGAKLIVREGQAAVFVNMGKIADVFQPGMHTLTTQNLPILATIMGWKYGFESPFKCEVYFVSTRRFTDQKWGTANPLMMRDKEFGAVRLRAYGTYAVQVSDAAAFLRQLISTDPQFASYEITGQLKNLIVSRFSDVLGGSGIPVLDMAGNLDELGKFVADRITPDFGAMGLSMPLFLVENISLPPNVEEMLDKRTSMGIVGNLDAFTKFQTAQAISDAAKNPSGMGGVGAGLGAGMAMAQQMMAAAAPTPQPPPLPTMAPWFASIGGAQSAPMDMATVMQQVAAGAIMRETLVWRQGLAAWMPAAQVAELQPAFAALPPPLPNR